MKKQQEAQKSKKTRKGATPDEVIAVIALALNEALLGDCDTEPRKLTIKRSQVSGAWALKTHQMRTLPIREY